MVRFGLGLSAVVAFVGSEVGRVCPLRAVRECVSVCACVCGQKEKKRGYVGENRHDSR